MSTPIKEYIKNKSRNAIIDKGLSMANGAKMGYSPTGCQEKQLATAIMCYHCMCNDVIFNDKQINNILNIVNTV